MGRNNLEYPRDARNTVNRLAKKRATYDLEKIHTIIQQTPVLHVSFSPTADDPFPAILPMIGFMGSFDSPSASLDEPLDCYLHGYVSSRIMNTARSSTANGSSPSGLPVTIAATKVDGLVLSLTPNSHSYNYRSAIVFGYAELVSDVAEKLWAMECITNKVVPDRWTNSRVPPNSGEMSSTQILRVRIVGGSGKIRDQGPGDEKVDLENQEVIGSVWTGVVPLIETLGIPVPSAYNQVSEVPAHVEGYRQLWNRRAEDYVQKVNGNVTGEMKRYGEI